MIVRAGTGSVPELRVKSGRQHKVRITRDSFLFALGVCIDISEIWLQKKIRGEALMIASLFLGLPVFLRRNGI